MQIVTLYNHKGGVSKTTTTFNLAKLLCLQGKRVLLVDADPQCNLTEVALATVIAQADERSRDSEQVEELPGSTLLDVLNQRIKGDVPFIDLAQVHVVPVAPSLDLIRGSVDLSAVEDELSEAHVQRFSGRTNLMRTYVAFGDFLVRLGERNAYDYVFIDVGPSSGALTRACFLACDGFFVPVAPDRFNVQAIRSLSRIVGRWINEHGAIVENFRALDLPVRPGRPVFLGAICQAYKTNKGRPKPAFQMWLNRLPLELSESLVPVLRKLSRADSDLCPLRDDECVAAEIPDFGSLAPLMHEVGKAVFEISREDTKLVTENGAPWQGKTWSGAQERMKSFREALDKVASRLVKLNA